MRKTAERRKGAEIFSHVSAFPATFFAKRVLDPVKVVKRTLTFQLLHFHADKGLGDDVFIFVEMVFVVVAAFLLVITVVFV